VYENQTKQAILQRMLAATPSDIDKRQGSITFDLLSPAAIEMAHAYIELDNVLRFGFAGPDQPSIFLDLRASEFGLTRRPSVRAQGALTFQGTNGTWIPAGTTVSTDEEIATVFETTEAGTITDGFIKVAARAVEGGKRGNIAMGRISLLLGDLSGVVAVTNQEHFVNGADTESDESLFQRYLDRVRKPATSGNAWHYRQWAMEVPGVGDVKVFPVWSGNGTVKLALLSDDKRAPESFIVDQVIEVVKERRPVGALVTVVPALEVAINVTARLTLAEDAVLADIRAKFQSELSDYLAELAFNDSIVRYNRIFGLLLEIESIIDFSELKINEVAGNIEIVGERVAVPGTVNFIVT
jgi:uncharacterized phage protein gp47/JayE